VHDLSIVGAALVLLGALGMASPGPRRPSWPRRLWGHPAHLSAGLRVVSALAVVIRLLATLVVLRRGGYRVPLISARAARGGTWVLTGLLSLGVLLNLASPSSWERFLQAPITAILATLCLIVARSRPRAANPAEDQEPREPSPARPGPNTKRSEPTSTSCGLPRTP